MKKQFFLLQILIFAFMQIAPMYAKPAFASDGSGVNSDAINALNNIALATQNYTTGTIQQPVTEAAVTFKTGPLRPRSYRLPDMILPDSTAFLYKYKNQIGQRVTVEGIVGRFGATFGEDFKEQIWQIEQEYKGKVEVILTLDSTIEDAKILKRQMDAQGHNMVIVKIPDWFQQRMLEHADAAAQGKIKQLLWETRTTFKQITTQPLATAKNTIAIFKNQYEKPSSKDIKIAMITTAIAGGVTVAGGMLGVGVDIMALTMATAMKVAVGGSVSTFSKSMANMVRSFSINDLKVRRGMSRVISEAVVALGSGFATSMGNMNPTQFLEASGSAVVESATSVEKEEKIKSQKAQAKLFWLTLAFGSVIGFASSMGATGPILLDTGFFQVTTLFAGSVIGFLTMLFAYKFKANAVEKIAEAELGKTSRYLHLESLQRRFKSKAPVFRTAPITCQGFFQ